jgi:hypothetical protein
MNFGKRVGHGPGEGLENKLAASLRVMANGHDVTKQMPQTAAELERQRPPVQQPNPPRPEAPAYVQTSENPLDVGGPMPKSIGRVADLYSDVRALRLAMDKEVETVKARESELRDYIITNLSKSDDTGAAGLRYRAQIVSKDVPRPADWKKIHDYIQDTGRFDLLQKRLGEKAVMDMVADNQTIPGIEIISVPDVSITKIGK